MSRPIIVLDAGHGGHDPGAVGNGIQEKNIVLDLALRTGKLLESMGAIIKYTRKVDVFVPLEERSNLANRWGADLFVSFHNNSFGDPSSNGFESFVYTSVNGGRTAAIQNVVHRKIATVFDSVGVRDRGQKKANLQVLRQTKMPAILLEYAFISNAKEATLLKDSAFLDRLARATAEGIGEALGLKALQKEVKKEGHKMKPEDANKIIETWLGPAWNFSQSEVDKKELNRLANEIRKSAGLPTQ